MQNTISRAEINLKDYIFIKELELGSLGRPRAYKDKKTNKDISVFKQIAYVSPTNFSMQFLKFPSNFPSLLPYNSVSKLACKDNNSIFLIITKFLDFGSLEKQISSQNLNQTDKTVTIFGIAAAIYYLHANNFFHGHLYPSNVLFNDQKEPQVCDFSLFQLHSHDISKIIEINKSSFLAPEQIFNSKIDAKTDVFSYGKLLLYILSDDLYYLDFYTELISKCCDKDPKNRPNFSDILQLFMKNKDFVLEGSDMQKISDYQHKLFPNGLQCKNTPIPKPLENRRLFLLPPVLNPEIKENFETENSKISSNSKSSLTIFSIEPNIFNGSKNLQKTKQYNLTVPVYNYHQPPSQKPIINEERKKKSQLHFFSSYIQQEKPPNQSEKVEIINTMKNETKNSGYTFDYKDEIESKIDANLKISADCGNVESQFKYGSILLNGPTETAQEGARYIKFAADGGYLQAQKLYAYLVRNGIIVQQNIKLGDHYMRLAADSGDLTSQIEYATILEKTASDISQTSINSNSSSSSSSSLNSSSNSSVAQVLKMAAKYYFLAAQQNDRNAQFIYGTFLEEGKGVQSDLDEAIRYFRLSADQGYTIAQLKLSTLLKGDESVHFLKLAADSRNTYAMVTYAKLLIRNTLNELDEFKSKHQLKKNIDDAMKYLEKAVSLESHMALYFIGCLMFYFSDVIVTKKLNFMGQKIEPLEKNFLSDDSDDDEEEDEKDNNNDFVEENKIEMNNCEEEEEEGVENKINEEKEIRNIDYYNNCGDDKNYYKIIKTIMKIITVYFNNKIRSENLLKMNDSKIKQIISHFWLKSITKKENLIKELKKKGYELIQKSSSLGNRRAQFQCALINMKFSEKVGVMDIKFFNNLISQSTSSTTQQNTSNNKKKYSFNSNDSFFSTNSEAYFDDYWDDNSPKIDNIDDKTIESVNLLIKSSRTGLSDSQYLLGLILKENSNINYSKSSTESDLKASELIKNAADSGSSRAQLAYALIIDDGHGNPKNLREASKYYRLSADGGNYSAMINIGFMLFDGRGVNRNRKEAVDYMKKAADANYNVACFKYGTMLYNGQGTTKDVKESVKYFEKVIKNEARATSPGIRYTSEISSLQMMQESARCIRSAAEQGVPEAMRVYAIMLFKEICFQCNVQEGFRWFKKAAKQNDPIALNFVANRIFKTGEGDRNSAVKMLKTAADNGYNIAQFNYAMIVEEGDETIDLQQNFSEAAFYYKKAADQNYAPAQLHYAMMLELGEGVNQNVKLAAFYYKKAARSQPDAMIHYGRMLRKGEYVKKNVKKALKCFKTAAKLGNKEGQYMFARMLQKGEGVKCNKNLAASLFKEAASQPMISRSLCTSKAQFRYAESLMEKGDCNFLHYNEATNYYLAASDYEEAPEMEAYKTFDKKVRKIRITLLFILLVIYIVQKLFL